MVTLETPGHTDGHNHRCRKYSKGSVVITPPRRAIAIIVPVLIALSRRTPHVLAIPAVLVVTVASQTRTLAIEVVTAVAPIVRGLWTPTVLVP